MHHQHKKDSARMIKLSSIIEEFSDRECVDREAS